MSRTSWKPGKPLGERPASGYDGGGRARSVADRLGFARVMLSTSVSLLERLRRPRDAEAWARFVALYTPLLLAWAHRLGLQPADAADLVQDVLVLLFQKLPEFTYDPGKSFRHWLHVVLRNKW